MTSPDISIIVPVHSLAHFSSTWNSLISVNSRNIELEIIIILDRVPKIDIESIVSLNNPKVQIIESKGTGIVATLNTGLSIAKGRYIARLDEDDLMLSKRLQSQMSYLERHSKCMAVGSSLILIDETNSWIGAAHYPGRINKIDSNIFKRNPIAHPSVMYRRLQVIDLGGYREGFAEDWDLWIRLLSKGYLRNSFKPFTAYRIHPNQLSRNKMYSTELAGTQLAHDFHSRLNVQQEKDELGGSLKASGPRNHLDFELKEIVEFYQLSHVPRKELIRTLSGLRFLSTIILRKLNSTCKNLLISTMYFTYIRKQLKRALTEYA